jgi:hypothetical protein
MYARERERRNEYTFNHPSVKRQAVLLFACYDMQRHKSQNFKCLIFEYKYIGSDLQAASGP